MRIVHVSVTPCAGAIEALSSAIRDYTEHDSRWISESGGVVNNLKFPADLTWATVEQFPLLSRADVIVIHNGGNPNHLTWQSEPMCDYLEGHAARKRVVFFYHSHPDVYGRSMQAEGYPVFCPAQYQATLWGEGVTPVRSVVRFDRSDWPERKERKDGKLRIGYSPTFRDEQSKHQPGSVGWYHCKGHEVIEPVLQELSKRKDVDYCPIEGLAYDMAIRLKAECDVLIDEIVTGSYHRNTLEGMALGLPTLCQVSPEVYGVMSRAAGSNDIPVIHADRENLKERLLWLLGMKKKTRLKFGAASRDWMVRHWHPRDIAQEFCTALEQAPVFAEVT